MFGIDDIISVGLKILDKVIPDPAAKAAAQLELIKQQQAGEFKKLEADLQSMQMQTDINKVEAGSQSLFVSGWRPAVGWVCVTGFGITALRPLLIWVAGLLGSPGIDFPQLDTSEMMQLLIGILGLGGYRTFEKYHGVHK